jgi:hypothetical protein
MLQCLSKRPIYTPLGRRLQPDNARASCSLSMLLYAGRRRKLLDLWENMRDANERKCCRDGVTTWSRGCDGKKLILRQERPPGRHAEASRSSPASPKKKKIERLDGIQKWQGQCGHDFPAQVSFVNSQNSQLKGPNTRTNSTESDRPHTVQLAEPDSKNLQPRPHETQLFVTCSSLLRTTQSSIISSLVSPQVLAFSFHSHTFRLVLSELHWDA